MKLYVDMDGTLARFYDSADAVTAYRTDRTFFARLGIYENLISALEALRAAGTEVIILSAVDEDIRERCVTQKRAWLNDAFHGNPPEALFPPTGKSKGAYVRNMHGFGGDSWLLDDYSHNLNDWMLSGGSGGIKALNEINGAGRKWTGPRLDINAEAGSILNSLVGILSGERCTA